MAALYKKVKRPRHSVFSLQYLPVRTADADADEDEDELAAAKRLEEERPRRSIFTGAAAVKMLLGTSVGLLGLLALTRAAYLDRRETSAPTTSSTEVPDYFQTTPEIFAGPTATGRAPFLAEVNPAPFGASRSFVPNTPLETALPIVGDTTNASIFQLMGQLSPYFPNPVGFGVNEYPLPSGTNISQVHMLHRHGSRYPTTGAGVQILGEGLSAMIANGSLSGFNGSLSFLNTWSYGLGNEILVPVGRQELYDSGVLHYYEYGHLYNTSSKIIARTTTQDRMLKSAENFMAGFFGLEWTNNATLELIIEGDNFNNSLAGYDNCNNSNTEVAAGGTNATIAWEGVYLTEATARLNAMSPNFKWNTSATYSAQSLCPYETVAFGYSPWCQLFTYSEWQGYEYSVDLNFAGNNYFQSPTGRAVGIGWVEELLARLQHHLLLTPTAQDNITLDSMPTTFPLDQSLYFDFSHDTNIAAVLTAFGLTQFAPLLPETGPIPPDHALVVSHLQPFGARLDIEIISAPQPVTADRTELGHDDANYTPGPPTKYIHFIINQRTLPLGASFAACGPRTDGWCELGTFVQIQQEALTNASYDFACNGVYPAVPYGTITNGAPLVGSSGVGR